MAEERAPQTTRERPAKPPPAPREVVRERPPKPPSAPRPIKKGR